MMLTHVKYTSDNGPADENRAPGLTWELGQGDCEDMALCVQRYCQINGIQAKVVVYQSNDRKRAHAVVLGVWEGASWFSSNGKYERISDESAVRDHIATLFGCAASQVEKR